MKVMQVQVDKSGAIVEVAAVHPDLAKKLWPDLEQHADAALKHAFDGATPNQVLEAIMAGRLLLLVMTVNDEIYASATFELSEHCNGKTLHCLTIGGEYMEFWIEEFMHVFKRLARELDCKYITFKGREGWARYARKLGFKHYYTQMIQEVETE